MPCTYWLLVPVRGSLLPWPPRPRLPAANPAYDEHRDKDRRHQVEFVGSFSLRSRGGEGAGGPGRPGQGTTPGVGGVLILATVYPPL